MNGSGKGFVGRIATEGSAARGDVAAALRHEQLAIRTIAVTFRAARRRAMSDPAMTHELREAWLSRWRTWALDALARYASTARALPIGDDGDLVTRITAVEKEFSTAVASVKNDTLG